MNIKHTAVVYYYEYFHINNKARPRERSDRDCFLPLGEKPLHTGVRTVQGAIIELVFLSVMRRFY